MEQRGLPLPVEGRTPWKNGLRIRNSRRERRGKPERSRRARRANCRRKGGKERRVQIFTNYRNSSWKLGLARVTSCEFLHAKILRSDLPQREEGRGGGQIGPPPTVCSASSMARREIIRRSRMLSRDRTKATTRSIIRPGGAPEERIERESDEERARTRERSSGSSTAGSLLLGGRIYGPSGRFVTIDARK